MAKTKKDKQREIFAKIAAVNTLLERYPVLTTTDPMLTNFSVNTSVGFLLSLLEVFGVSQADIINWICKLLGDRNDGVLVAIEYAIKGILMANIKKTFSCDFNPILPDNLMRYAIDSGSRQDPNADFPYNAEKKNHIEINLQEVDLFGLLANCPSNKKGGVFYFDAYEPKKTSIIEISGNTRTIEEPNYIPSELYKSRDFNAFLWYVINKGNIGSPSDKQKNTWDNRNKVYKKFEGTDTTSTTIKDNFYEPIVGTKADTYKSQPRIPIYVDETQPNAQPVLYKEQYIICEYNERGSNQKYSNVLNVWLNADRYYRTRSFKTPVGKDEHGQPVYQEIGINKTIFEFNYDYIYSLQLFDTKTLVANIVNSLLGIASSFSISFSLEQKQVQKKVETIVEKIMAEDDTEVADDCFYRFDNAMYQQMIDEVTKSYTGSYQEISTPYATTYDDVYDALGNLGSVTEKAGQSELLKKVIESTARAMEGNIDGGIEIVANFTIGADFIVNFVKQIVTQIVLQVLSPKVGVLFGINSQILGDIGDLNDWENFMRNFDNLIKNIVSSVKDIIIKELYNFVMQQLQPLLELLIAKLALETIKYYKDLIMNLITNCIPNFNFNGGALSTVIDNVNYADIIVNTGKEATRETPETNC